MVRLWGSGFVRILFILIVCILLLLRPTAYHMQYRRHNYPIFSSFPYPQRFKRGGWPYTLHPAPYTLHPTPYTPHPTPYTYRLWGSGFVRFILIV